MKDKIIFDLDGTIMNADFSLEDQFFRDKLSAEDAEKFIPIKYNLLLKYENLFYKYDISYLSEFLTSESGVVISDKLIKEWLVIGDSFNDKLVPDIVDVFEYLKGKDYELIVLSNWFRTTQVSRLKKMMVLDYFTDVYGGDQFIKPNPDSYLNVCNKNTVSNCVMIGDDYFKDFLGPKSVGMESVLFDPNDKVLEKCKIKRMNELKEMF